VISRRPAVVDITEGTVASLELWFRVLHDKMIDEMYTVSNKDVWEAIEVCGYRAFDIEKLNAWFAKWWEKKEQSSIKLPEMRQLLFPCHEFDHAQGWKFVTRKLVYESSEHITEDNPTAHRHLQLEGNVIGRLCSPPIVVASNVLTINTGSLNGARGSFRSKLIRGLFDPVDKFLHQDCDCKEESL
jgi:hypothetical protein